MTDVTRVEIEKDVAEKVARRAAEEGVTLTAYISSLLRRSLERAPGEDSVLVYDHVKQEGELDIHRESNENDENYAQRSTLYDRLFARRD
jgi:hypothetical protein